MYLCACVCCAQKLLNAEKQLTTIYRERGGEGMKRGATETETQLLKQ